MVAATKDFRAFYILSHSLHSFTRRVLFILDTNWTHADGVNPSVETVFNRHTLPLNRFSFSTITSYPPKVFQRHHSLFLAERSGFMGSGFAIARVDPGYRRSLFSCPGDYSASATLSLIVN